MPSDPHEGDAEDASEDGLPPTHYLSQPTLDVDGWLQSSFKQNCEALVFIHGYAATTHGSAKARGRWLVDLGDGEEGGEDGSSRRR